MKKNKEAGHGSPVRREALLRSGAGKHGDKRMKRNKDRSAVKRNAIREAT